MAELIQNKHYKYSDNYDQTLPPTNSNKVCSHPNILKSQPLPRSQQPQWQQPRATATSLAAPG